MRSQVRALLSPPQSGTVSTVPFLLQKIHAPKDDLKSRQIFPHSEHCKNPLSILPKRHFGICKRNVSRVMQTLILNLWKERLPNIAKQSFLRRCSKPNPSFRQSTPPRACLSFEAYHVRNKPPLIGVMTGNDKQNESHFFSLYLMKLTKIFREICVKSSKMWRFGG